VLALADRADRLVGFGAMSLLSWSSTPSNRTRDELVDAVF
jgi:hypothetical protein